MKLCWDLNQWSISSVAQAGAASMTARNRRLYTAISGQADGWSNGPLGSIADRALMVHTTGQP
jgi:hypothetical protein